MAEPPKVDTTMYAGSDDKEIADYSDLYPDQDDENEGRTEGMSSEEGSMVYAESREQNNKAFKRIMRGMKDERNEQREHSSGVMVVDSSDPQYSVDFNSLGSDGL
eukprot:TRINITY_DN1514_c0_g1_i1.p1 TRINITY_DN1514_c0_g1~~TRINITY_DN1514_c0_g1_i1.p1  ORF type:complete len:105 (-),score=26.36 TRINITY_DN1514_c0_g1_i1:66-380(-)